MRNRLLWILLHVGSTAITVLQNAGGTSVWDGVFTATQVERGKASYTDHCSSCHGPEMNANAAALTGDPFWQRWREDSLESLFSVIRESMPRDAPGSLSATEYADVTAYLLAVNGVPAGSRELTPDAVIGIRVQGREGPRPVPNSALVQVVGCLDRSPDASFALTNATEPVRTRNPSAGVQDVVSSQLPAAHRFGLISMYPKPEGLEGHKLLVKGLLVRSDRIDRLNVTSWVIVSRRCED